MRVVLGLWLLQAVSAAATWLALSSTSKDQIILWVGLVMGIGLLAALWLWSALRDQRRLGEAHRSERLANRNAELHAKLARQRAEDVAQLRSLSEKVSAGRNRLLKAGFLCGIGLGLGVAVMLMQFLTLGLVALAVAGGGIGGYVARGWLDRRAIPGSRALAGTASPAPPKLPAPRGVRLTLRSEKARAA